MSARRIIATLAAASAALLVTACAGDSLDSSATDSEAGSDSETTSESATGDAGSAGGPVRISGQNFTEATIVAAMYAAVLENAGYTPEVKLVDTRDVYMADFPGGVDVVPEYVGAIANFLNSQANGDDAEPMTTSDPAQMITDAQQLLDDQGITLLEPSSATDTNAFFVTQEFSDENGVTKLSDLEGMSVVLAAAPDCEGRLDCEGGLSEQYGIKITEVLPLGYASNDTYQAVLDNEAQLGETSTTDSTLGAQGLVLLEDDKQIQPAQNLVPAVANEFLEAHPDVADTLNALMAALTTENLTELNGKVSVDREKPEDVAEEFLTEAGLL